MIPNATERSVVSNISGQKIKMAFDATAEAHRKGDMTSKHDWDLREIRWYKEFGRPIKQ